MDARQICLLSTLAVCLLHPVEVNAIFTTQWPVSTSQFENSDVEFHCEVHEKGDNDHLVWFTDMDATDTLITFTFANQTTVSEYDDPLLHGQHKLDYESTSDGVYRLTYRISGLKLADEGLYTCGFIPLPVPESISWDNFLGDSAHLKVLVPPADTHPQCDFDPLDSSSFNGSSVIPLTFSCEMAGGKPAPELTWYKNNDSITAGATESNRLSYTLSAEDNGVEFTCIASGESLLQNASCSVIPLVIPPTVSITSSSAYITPRGTASFSCVGDGLPRVSEIEWFINGITTNEIEKLEFEIRDNQTDSSSRLNIFNAPFEREDNEIECVVKIPSGLSSSASVTLFCKECRNKFSLFIPLLPVLAATSGLLVTILVVFIIICLCKSSKEGFSDRGEPIDAHAHINPYADSDNPHPYGDGYVIDQLPGAPRGATIRSEYAYATIQRDATLNVIPARPI